MQEIGQKAIWWNTTHLKFHLTWSHFTDSGGITISTGSLWWQFNFNNSIFKQKNQFLNFALKFACTKIFSPFIDLCSSDIFWAQRLIIYKNGLLDLKYWYKFYRKFHHIQRVNKLIILGDPNTINTQTICYHMQILNIQNIIDV